MVATERLVLREAGTGDLTILERMWRDPVVRRHLGGPLSEEAVAARRSAGGVGGFMAELHSGEVVGWCHLGRYRTGELELSYAFLPGHWGRGYAREACGAIVGVAFESFPDDARLIAVTQEANGRSVRLLEALGMTRVDRFDEFGACQVRYALDRPLAGRAGHP
ncbi:GNAT family N-acetyltransferase [Micromonospora sp. RTGN7]|uniref:GNAT family N-acetyltransferase n=1 Tax=Micromonospora sp. RTGN7 TaxID=3016526 RepID=UPI0029FEFC20|nr:GNAT family N-acetyltransferase [Micromonospora sp. RTGN7]